MMRSCIQECEVARYRVIERQLHELHNRKRVDDYRSIHYSEERDEV